MAWLSDLTRFIQFACVLSLLGTTFWSLERYQPSSTAQLQSRRLPVIYATACLIAAAATVGWLLIEAAMIAGGWSAVAEVVTSARFGRAAALRVVLLLIAARVVLLMPRRSRIPRAALASLCAAATVSFVWTGHGTVGTGTAAAVHAFADGIHLFCAALWIGALLMFMTSVRQALIAGTSERVATLLKGLLQFSATGPALIGLLILTGLINTWLLVAPHWSALLLEPYGLLLVGKIAVFAVMLVFAAYHRYRSTPRLRRMIDDVPSGAGNLSLLQRTLIAETALALLVLAFVAVLGALMPPA